MLIPDLSTLTRAEKTKSTSFKILFVKTIKKEIKKEIIITNLARSCLFPHSLEIRDLEMLRPLSVLDAGMEFILYQ